MTKYNFDLLDVVDDEQKLLNFLRMEKWIADRPHHPGRGGQAVAEGSLPGQQARAERVRARRPQGRSEEHHLPGAQRLRQGRPHHSAGDLAGARAARSARRTTPSWRSRAGMSASSSAASRRSCSARASPSGSRTINPALSRRQSDGARQQQDRPGRGCGRDRAAGRHGRDLRVRGRRHAGRASSPRSSERFLDTGAPRDLTLVFAAAPGDGKDKGLNRLAREGLVRRVIGGHFGLVPKLARMATDGPIEAYNLPLGCISQLFREIAGRKAGPALEGRACSTFVDPRAGRRQAQRAHDGGPRRAHRASATSPGCSTRPSRSRSRSCAARRPTRTATSRWSARR